MNLKAPNSLHWMLVTKSTPVASCHLEQVSKKLANQKADRYPQQSTAPVDLSGPVHFSIVGAWAVYCSLTQCFLFFVNEGLLSAWQGNPFLINDVHGQSMTQSQQMLGRVLAILLPGQWMDE